MQEESNIGQTGVESIRIGGVRPGNLPLAEAADAKFKLPEAVRVERQQKIDEIKAAAPKASVDYIKSRIKEAHDNITRIQDMKSRENTMISEYTGLISMCEFRDSELAQTDDKEKIKELKKRFPPYNVDAMKQQIVQSKETIERCEGVIAKENASIAELHEAMTQCERRDVDLKNLGAELP